MREFGVDSPHGADEEVEHADHGDADQDVEGPLDHGAVHAEAAERALVGAVVGRVHPAGAVGHRGSERGDGGDGGGGSGSGRSGGGSVVRILRQRHQEPAERNQNHRENPAGSHFRDPRTYRDRRRSEPGQVCGVTSTSR